MTPPGLCSKCVGERIEGWLHHLPECEFYSPRQFFLQHPDICELDSNLDYWYVEGKEG